MLRSPYPTLQAYLDAAPLFSVRPFAAGDPEFVWCVTDASREMQPRVIRAQFGDGYAQRTADGINTLQGKWNVSMKNVLPDVAREVDVFLAARNGVECFWWTPPRTGTRAWVLCPRWTSAYGELAGDGSRLWDFTMDFQTEPS
ncbi:phage tail protein [Cupriavidus taiwanensis]|uniref:phage tail protein n=1 Tax=Cupriavidus taiwanensis TaxID=164546 RepID=UPI000E18B7E9|nr:phage tail protein [Cupriavidus taiwanensis]SPA17260.1 Minor tail family protein [Cupriavidus taiwanensis]